MIRGIDWDSPDWGGHVTEADNGSWIDCEPAKRPVSVLGL